MMAVAKPSFSFFPRTALLGYALMMSLLLFGYSVNQYWQHNHYLGLEQHIEPVVEALNDLQHKVVTNADKDWLLNEKITHLSFSIQQFVAFVNDRRNPVAGLDEVLTALEDYQLKLQNLQDLDMHSRYALNAFAERVRTVVDKDDSYYSILLRRSRLYLNAPNVQYLYALDDDASRWQTEVQTSNQDLFHYYQLYRQSLTPLVLQRHALLTDNKGVLIRFKTQWQQASYQYLQDMQLALLVWLLFGFSLGLAVLFLHNQQLRKVSKASLDLARAKTDFLANMSHEIRTPMNAVIGFASLLQQTPLTLSQQQYLKKISQSSDNLLLLINDILDLTKVEAGKLELEDIVFDLNELLDKLSGLFADLSEHKQLEVIIDKAENVPNCWRGDPLRLGQILINLVSNAVKFTERGEVVLSVHCQPGPEPMLCFTVKDTGIGIVPDKLGRLFHAFTQVDASTTRKYGGTGLGLSITYHLVQLMQGHIEVSSQAGRGSTFSVSLPLHLAEQKVVASDPAFQGKKVLLVDDNRLVLEVTSQLLRQLGLVVYSAANLDQAKEIVQKQGEQLSLALIDCCLAQDDGLELARFIRSQESLTQLAIVIMSAFGQEKVADQMRFLGLMHYLAKPITEQSIRTSVTRALGPKMLAAPLEPSVVNEYQLADFRRQLLGKQILLAEDNRMNQQLIVEFLNQVGVSVTMADNGRQAVELMSKQPFDAILMDLQMPILDGIEATRQIRKLNRQHDIPIIALTASAMRGDREISLKAGMNSYVTKPVDRFALYQALLQLVGPQVDLPKTPLSPTQQPDQDAEPALLAANTAPDTDSAQTRDEFLAQQQDLVWQLTALLAAKDWAQAQQLIKELTQGAERYAEYALAEQARLIGAHLQQQQRPTPSELNLLKQRLSEATQVS